MNVAAVAPAGTVNDPGTVATEVLLEVRVTAKPPVGAGICREMVPVELFPPITAFGLSEMLEMAWGLTVRFVDVLFGLNVAVIAAVVTVVTIVVLTVKVAEFAPAATVTDAGTVAAPLFDERLIDQPPAGAEPPSVSEPAEVAPAITEVGFNVKLVMRGVLTVKVVLPVAPA